MENGFGTLVMAREVDAHLVTDAEGRILSADPEAEAMLGRREQELLGESVKGFLDERGREVLDAQLRDLDVAEPHRQWRSAMVRASQDIVEAMIDLEGVYDHDRRLDGLRWRLHRVADDRRVAVGRTAAEHYRWIVENTREGVWMIDVEGVTTYANRRMAAMLGLEPRELVGRFFSDFLFPDDQERAGADLKELTRRGGDGELDVRLRRHDGSAIWVRVGFTTVAGESGRNVGFLGLFTDITDRKRAEESLRQSEEKFRVLADGASDPIGIVQGRRFTYVNPFLERLSGYSREELLSMDVAQLVHPDYRPLVMDRARRRQMGEPLPSHYEYKMVTRTGEARWMQLSVSRIELKGAPALIGIAHDVTDRREAEEAVKRERAFLRQVIDAVPGFVFVKDAEGRFELANRSVAEAYGTTVEAIVGRTDADYTASEEEVRRFRDNDLQVIGSGSPLHIPEEKVTDAGGRRRWLTTYKVPLADEQGQCNRVLGVSTDITDLKEAQEALTRSERIKSLVLNATAELFTYYDRDLRILWVNRAAAEAAGVPVSQIVGRRCYDVWHGRAAACTPCPMVRAIETGRDQEEEVKTADGRVWRVRSYPVLDERGHVEGLVCFGQDITDHRKAEEALQRTHEELERRVAERTAELEEANRELRRSNQDLQSFAYASSHDLQEPLRTVATYVQVLEKRYGDQLDDQARQYIDFAVQGAKRMHFLIRGLLAYSRVSTQIRPAAPTDAGKVLDEAIDNLGLTIEENGAQVTADPLPVVRADPVQLLQVFQNLLANALKFRHPDRRPVVHVGVERQDGEWVFLVRDNGIGIEPQYFGRVFDIFQRLSPGGDYEGTGIGLALVKRIVERHGGRVWVDSDFGEGSTFFFSLPLPD